MKKLLYIIFLSLAVILTLSRPLNNVLAVGTSMACNGTGYGKTAAQFFGFYGANQWSLEMQVRVAASNVSEKGIFQLATGANSGGPQLLLQRNGEFMRQYYGGYVTDSASTPLTTGVWHTIYFAHDNIAQKAYFGVDGVVREVPDTMLAPTGIDDFWVCNGYSTSFAGDVADLKFWKGTIKYTTNYGTDNSICGFGSGDLQYHWPFDEGAGTIANDICADHANMNLAGITWNIAPTPTPTPPPPTPTPTPSVAPTPTPLPVAGQCLAWYDHQNNVGNGVWYIQNAYTQNITQVIGYGTFCSPDHVTCGFGWSSISGGVTGDSNTPDGFTTAHLDNVQSFNNGDIVALNTDYQLQYVTCKFTDGHISESATPYGKTMQNPTQPEIITGAGVPTSCTDLSFTVPVINWSFTFPNWLCQLKQWLYQTYIYFFGFSRTVAESDINDFKTLINAKAPFGYFTAAFAVDWSQLNNPSTTIPTLNIPIYGKMHGQTVFTGALVANGADMEFVHPFINTIRNFVAVILWVGFVFFLVYEAKQLL